MLERLLSRLTGGRPEGMDPAPDAVVVLDDHTDAPLPETAPASPVRRSLPSLTLRPEESDDALALLLGAELDLRLNTLHASAAVDGEPDPALTEFLDQFASGRRTSIRQPPLAAQRALIQSQDPEVDLNDLVRLFEGDPTLAQAALRRSNSAAYAGGETIVSVRDAISRIGLAGVQSVVVQTMLEGVLCRPGGRYDAMVQEVWSHMVRSAPIARTLAPAFGCEPDAAFTLALLHDAGKLVVFDRLSTWRAVHHKVANFPGGFVEGALRSLHEALGGLTVLSWGLGATAARAVATHHRTALRYEDEHYSEVLCLAEQVDHLIARRVPLDLEGLWVERDLHGDLGYARDLLTLFRS